MKEQCNNNAQINKNLLKTPCLDFFLLNGHKIKI